MIGVVRERAARERRVAITPREAARLVAAGIGVSVERDAGQAAGFSDDAYAEAGCTLVDDAGSTVDIVAGVGPPSVAQVQRMGPTTIVLGLLAPEANHELISEMVDRGIEAYAFELIPRTTRAQGMDALSSQATAAGYAATVLAARLCPRMFPMLTTAAGTLPPADVLVLGAGVAGLQAIATARRLGAVVSAYDLRPEVAEQISSLGAKPIAAPHAETTSESGYASEVADDVARAQLEALTPHVAAADVVITTAQIPGRPAPLLVTRAMVEAMSPGSVIVDMAASSGGNCEPTVADEDVEIGGVRVAGPTDLASHVAHDASRMLGRNVEAFLGLLLDGDHVRPDRDDEILDAARVSPPRAPEPTADDPSSTEDPP